MDMHVDATRGDDFAFAGDHLSSCSNDYGDLRLYVRISCFTNCSNSSVFDSDISFDNSPVIQNERVCDYCVDRAFGTRPLRLTHAVPNDFSTTELYLLAIHSEVLLYLDDEISIREAHFVADRWAKHLGISVSLHRVRHLRTSLWQWSHDRLVEAVDEARTRIQYQRNFARLAGLEAHCRPRRNVEPKTEGRLTIKCQSRVCFSEMVVTTHLYRSVASVSDCQGDDGSILVQD